MGPTGSDKEAVRGASEDANRGFQSFLCPDFETAFSRLTPFKSILHVMVWMSLFDKTQLPDCTIDVIPVLTVLGVLLFNLDILE